MIENVEFIAVKYAYFWKFDIKYSIGLQMIYSIFLAEKSSVNLSRLKGSYET